MDLFKFAQAGGTTFDGAESINGYSRITWVERYSTPGEFTLEAKSSSGLAEFLPLGSMISHIDTMEVMIVENHEIEEKVSDDPIITITGRSFVSFLENRIVGMNSARAGSTIAPYVTTAIGPHAQIVKMINDHIVSPPANANDVITNVIATHSIGYEGTGVAETIEFGNLLDRVLEKLKVWNYGIRTIRRNPFGIPGGDSTQTVINIYAGPAQTAMSPPITLMFSWISGDIIEAHYLFSQKNNKNAALVVSKYFQVVVDGSETKYDRRTMLVDASILDNDLDAVPTGVTKDNILNGMNSWGVSALANQNATSLTQIDLSPNTKPQFRRDYNIGDLVLIDANYGEIVVKRITEYAEIQDENSTTGHPTLADPITGD